MSAAHHYPVAEVLTEREQAILKIIATDGVTVFEFRADMPGILAQGLAERGRNQTDFYFLTRLGQTVLKEIDHVQGR